MEFKIPDRFIKPYVENAKKLISEQSQKKYSEDEIWKNVINYLLENELEYIPQREHYGSCCYEFALNELRLNYPNSSILDGFHFSSFINSNKSFREIESKDEIRTNQLVVYYLNPKEYLHAALIKSIENDKIRLISQWGDEIQIRHPLERVDITYGNKYKIFEINKLEEGICESQEDKRFNEMNKILNEIRSWEDILH